MGDLIARCGYRCDLCPAYRENVRGKEDQQRTSDGWFRYYGFRIPPEEICCDGCLAEDASKPKRMDPDCPVRPCVKGKGLANCAYCGEYVCKKLETRLIEYEDVAERFKQPIPREDYESFIRPYEGRRVLDRIREKLARNVR